MAERKTPNEKEEVREAQAPLPKCGIIMPISSIDGCSADHWKEVLLILKEVARDAGFEPNLVSDADEIGIIQKRIIQNIYDNEMVICDVSCKNPNVMFELGMRLAFDKPTIIIKDDETSYTFDTSVIEHLEYPRDHRFHKILLFRENLGKKLKATYHKSQNDDSYTTFLKNFGEYKVAHLDKEEISSDQYILETLAELRADIRLIRNEKTTLGASASHGQYIRSLRKNSNFNATDEKLESIISDYLEVTPGLELPLRNLGEIKRLSRKIRGYHEFMFDTVFTEDAKRRLDEILTRQYLS